MIAAALLVLASAAAPDIPVLPDAKAFEQTLLAQQQDGRPLIVHFFATWCEPCREELPRIRPALQQAAKRGARVVLFSLDDRKDKKVVERFLRKFGLDAPAWILAAPDPEPIAALLDPNWSGGLPATFVVQRGRLLQSFLGPVKTPRALLSALPAAH